MPMLRLRFLVTLDLTADIFSGISPVPLLALAPQPAPGFTRPFMFEQAFRNIDDILRKEAGCTTELDYTEQSSWLLFLKYLDSLEADKATEAALEGKK